MMPAWAGTPVNTSSGDRINNQILFRFIKSSFTGTDITSGFLRSPETLSAEQKPTKREIKYLRPRVESSTIPFNCHKYANSIGKSTPKTNRSGNFPKKQYAARRH